MMDEPLRPEYEGVQFKGPATDSVGRIKKHALNIGAAKRLCELEGEYVFFTPAVLYLYARFIDAPLIDYIVAMGEDVPLYYYVAPQAIFSGLETPSGDRAWNHALWAVARPYWQSLHDWIGSLILIYQDTRTVFGIGSKEFVVPDPLSPLWTIPVTTFGINGADYRLGFAADALSGLLVLGRYPGDPTMRVYTEALYSGENPVNARTSYAFGGDDGSESGAREER
jgi:hypothetical protein